MMLRSSQPQFALVLLGLHHLSPTKQQQPKQQASAPKPQSASAPKGDSGKQALSPEDQEYFNLLQEVINEVSAPARVPPSQMSDSAQNKKSAQYSNFEEWMAQSDVYFKGIKEIGKNYDSAKEAHDKVRVCAGCDRPVSALAE